MTRVVHFELNSSNPESIIKFFSATFGWEFKKVPGPVDHWAIQTGNENELGINGGLSKSEGSVALISNTIEVSSLDEYVKKIEENGGKIIVRRIVIPRIGIGATFEDPEGRLFNLIERQK
ncbi:MAG: VOC family protein [Candidatus Helarchaeota archaeon]